jgi:hypothetical protein
MKIGWPGFLLIEVAEEDCIAFYDTVCPFGVAISSDTRRRTRNSTPITITAQCSSSRSIITFGSKDNKRRAHPTA